MSAPRQAGPRDHGWRAPAVSEAVRVWARLSGERQRVRLADERFSKDAGFDSSERLRRKIIPCRRIARFASQARPLRQTDGKMREENRCLKLHNSYEHVIWHGLTPRSQRDPSIWH